MALNRRDFLQRGGAALVPFGAAAADRGAAAKAKADYSIRIARGLVEVAPDQIISTTLYNGQFPGPLLRFREGQAAIVDIRNDSDSNEILHWHGQKISSLLDGAEEEGSPILRPGECVRQHFTPGPSGLRFYHTHSRAGENLDRGLYSGLAGPVYIEPKENAGAYDQEIFLVLKEFGPTLSRGGDMAQGFLAGSEITALKAPGEAAMAASTARGEKPGYEVGYQFFCINGRALGHGEPIRVRQGQRVLFHIVNASAGEIRSLALPGHRFRVLALDGNNVPTQAETPVLWIGTAERISAVVEMTTPGVWVLGDLADDDRGHGMGIVVEYEGAHRPPVWRKPADYRWDYGIFGTQSAPPPPDAMFEMVIAKVNAADGGFNRWTINGRAFEGDMAAMAPLLRLRRGARYRLRLRNQSDDIHPVHLHRHSFELTKIAGKLTAGVVKDVVMLGGYQEAEIDFSADNPGKTLFHCHQQLHMDFGFMALFDYAES